MKSELPIYQRIKQEIIAKIESGGLLEGDPVPSEYQLASELGVSRHQTRQALRELELGGYLLRSQGRRSVVAPASQRAGNLPVDGDRTIAIALQSLDTLHNGLIFDGAMEGLRNSGYQSIAYNLYFDEQGEVRFLRHVQTMGMAGLIIWLQHANSEARRLLSAFTGDGFPVVMVDRYVGGVEADFVVTNNQGMVYQLTKQLIERGHRRIGWIQDPHEASSNDDRFSGYRRALDDAGLEFRGNYCGVVHRDYAEAAETFSRIMSFREPPTAFVCIHDLHVDQVVKGLGRLGYKVPDDVELAMVGDERNAEELEIPTISVSQPSFEIGRKAVEILLARLADPKRPVERCFLQPVLAGAGAEDGARRLGSRRLAVESLR